MVSWIAMPTGIVQESVVQRVQQHGYRGRVRSGCLTCRSRKVRCDEMLPVCNNCTRLKRRCVYKPRKNQQPVVTTPSPINETQKEAGHIPGSRQLPETSSTIQPYSSPPSEEENDVVEEIFRLDTATSISWRGVQGPLISPDSSTLHVTAYLENALRRQNEISIPVDGPECNVPSHLTLISRDIKLTTTMDILTAGETSSQPSISFFLESVDSPWITPYDSLNWRRMKLEVVELGISNSAIASAIMAVSMLYKAQMYRLPLSKALSLYHSSKSAYEKLLNDQTQSFSMTLVAAFLLCLFELVHYEAVPILKEPSEAFVEKLKSWAQHEQPHSEFSLRIIAWLRLLHVTTLRGGGMGIISDDICSTFPSLHAGVPNLRSPSHHLSDTSAQLYEVLSTPVFDMYFRLQMMSGEIARLTHYHRSRTTGIDQEEVVRKLSDIKSQIHKLWENRSAIQCQTSEDLRSHLAPQIANPIITLVGICAAAYHTEIVEMDRVMGDPVSKSIESKQARGHIREIIDGDWNAYDGGKLNEGFLRPLFLYAIECMDPDENQWAVERLEQIKSPICRSEFFASFGKALSDAQLQKERRVTSKYFCLWYFGVPPPFM